MYGVFEADRGAKSPCNGVEFTVEFLNLSEGYVNSVGATARD